MNLFLARPIRPPRASFAKVRLNVLNALRKERTVVVGMMRLTISTWQEERPSFGARRGQISLSGGNASVTIVPEGNTKGVKKWTWLNNGTSVRYARLSRDWISKTSPGVLGAGRGRGQVVLRGRKAGPHPGIQARLWTQLIVDLRRTPFAANVSRAVNTGARGLYG